MIIFTGFNYIGQRQDEAAAKKTPNGEYSWSDGK